MGALYQALDVNMFGAKGDDTGDDTGAINAALAASKKIFLRPGGVEPPPEGSSLCMVPACFIL